MHMMRQSCNVAVFLAWLCAVACTADLHATTMLPGEPLDADQSLGDRHAVTVLAASIWDQTATWVWTKQQEYLLQLSQELGSLRGQHSVGWALVLMSFLYGVLHAAGPGHGKVVLTTYLLTHRSRLNRGIAMGTAAAFLQGMTALLMIYAPIGLAGWLPVETDTATLWATRVSFTMLAIVGIYLLVRASRALYESIRQFRRETGEVGHDHVGHDHAGHDHAGHDHAGHDHAGHDHVGHDHAGHGHGDGAGCGCRHMPSAAEIDTAGSRHAAAGVVLAIGMRPCSGALFVLIIAAMMGLIWHGTLSVIAMSTGTAITVVILAIVATKARDLARKVVAHRSPLWALLAAGLGALGGAILLLMALWALNTSFMLNQIVDL